MRFQYLLSIVCCSVVLATSLPVFAQKLAPTPQGTPSKTRSNNEQQQADTGDNDSDIPQPVKDMLAAISDVKKNTRQDFHEKTEIPELEHDIKVFTVAINDEVLNQNGRVIAHYFRAEARKQIGFIQLNAKDYVDPLETMKALADYQNVIDAGLEVTQYNISVSQSKYQAGRIAKSLLESTPLAYAYWESCAQLGHAGCMNIIANVRLTGKDGQKVDVNEAIDLNKKVYQTGTQYQCAGVYSALTIAEIAYFLGIHQANEEEMDWVNKANALLEKLSKQWGQENMCVRPAILVEEYLLHLSHGEHQEDLLRDGARMLDNRDTSGTREIIQFLLGKVDTDQFEKSVSALDNDVHCGEYFDGLWFAELIHKPELAQKYYNYMLDIGAESCGSDLIYAKKFNLPDTRPNCQKQEATH